MMFSIVMSSYFMPRRASTILKYSSEVCALARPTRLPRRSSTRAMPASLRATIARGSSALSRVASFMMMPITRNGSPPWRALRKVVTLMSPICTSRFCMALTMSVPVLTILRRTSTPCRRNRPLSTPTSIGRWPKLLPTTASTTACAAAGVVDATAQTSRAAVAALPVFRNQVMIAPDLRPGRRGPAPAARVPAILEHSAAKGLGRPSLAIRPASAPTAATPPSGPRDQVFGRRSVRRPVEQDQHAPWLAGRILEHEQRLGLALACQVRRHGDLAQPRERAGLVVPEEDGRLDRLLRNRPGEHEKPAFDRRQVADSGAVAEPERNDPRVEIPVGGEHRGRIDAEDEALRIHGGAAQAEIETAVLGRDALDVDAVIRQGLVVEGIDRLAVGDGLAETSGRFQVDLLARPKGRPAGRCVHGNAEHDVARVVRPVLVAAAAVRPDHVERAVGVGGAFGIGIARVVILETDHLARHDGRPVEREQLRVGLVVVDDETRREGRRRRRAGGAAQIRSRPRVAGEVGLDIPGRGGREPRLGAQGVAGKKACNCESEETARRPDTHGCAPLVSRFYSARRPCSQRRGGPATAAPAAPAR